MKSLFPVIRQVAPPSAVVAGLISVLVGTASSAAIVFAAAKAAGASSGELASWMLALGVGMGATCIGLSLRYRTPVVTAWSTPGAAVLATSLLGATMAQAIGAFLVSAALITLSGVTGWFARVMDRIPVAIAAALLAGVLAEFGTGLFTAMHTSFGVVFPMFVVYLLCRRWWARYAVLAALVTGVVAAVLSGSIRLDTVDLAVATPVFTVPQFSWPVIVGAGLPLFVVTMASQNLAGVAVLRNDGYQVPVSPLIGWTGAANLVLAPFGCFGLNLAAITAAICTGRQAHEDPARRFLAGVWAGVFFLSLGVLGGTVGSLLTALPMPLIAGIGGLGLLNTIISSLTSALADERWREAAVVTFLATASGVTLLGIGSAFWGLLAGVVTGVVTRSRRKARQVEQSAGAAADDDPVSSAGTRG
ncbi:benzoate/H(+) symporter BenE family transporter [Amycolatopsis sp. SID8362]|uniref:benzoate/H(+) symporter BenE family transporter n=1 Tax=Amycolatopsis sp. SID8362 TaxID=2690346 RepID=UPI00136C1100|nr:benzoate/H(+) symporter BenE family transporter [Amycolatopsis sp. SID8362]NBH04613.1 benzoate/H(+) symporter BenE family transporter [Amycolatopsis sp. SID8362]NED41312.1 benzoate/H(+) symporter BenE family transporter [Amycolatopsis sp. SID8362]